MSWQWVAGCGADAAPFFLIFNPERQRERFDADGEYVRTWAPELAAGHAPGFADGEKIIDLGESRREALAA